MKPLTLLAFCLLLRLPAFGWGSEGHQIVALVAYDLMEPATRIRVNRLLSDTPGTVGPELLREASVWADEIQQQPETRVAIFTNLMVRNAAGTHPLHYADMAGNHYNPATDGDEGRSVVTALERCKEVLRSGTSTPAEKREALKFLVHFVGDIHQPLHAGRKADKGGNAIHVERFLNRRSPKGFSLHQVWDSLLIQSKPVAAVKYATDLRAGLSPAAIAEYRQETDTVKWLEASHALALSNAYVDAKGKPLANEVSLGQDYATKNLPVVDQQLAKAGVRLAVLLDELLK